MMILVSDLFYYFKSMNIVEMFGIFNKNCWLIDITAKYCQKITFFHFWKLVQQHIVGEVKSL